MKAPIHAAGVQAGPATPVIAAMLGGQRLEVSISLKDVTVPAAEVRKLSGQRLDAGSDASADLAEAGVQGGEHAAACFPGVRELHAVSGSRRTAAHHGIEEALAQRRPGRIFRQRAERDRTRSLAQEGAAVGRRVEKSGGTLRPELDAVEAQAGDE